METERRELEREFQTWVTDALDLHGWLYCHFRPARTDHGWRTALSGAPGFPDIVAVKDRRVLFIELKSDKGKLSDAQMTWAFSLPNYHLWRPSDRDKILEVLSA